MTTPYHNLTLTEIHDRLRKAIAMSEQTLTETCKLLAELKRRGETHPMMTRGLFKWFDAIDSGKLLPSIVIKFAGEDQIISRMIALPEPQQNAIAETGTVKVAELDKTGNVIELDKPIIRMNLDQIKRTFDAGKLRTPTQQAKLLKQEQAHKLTAPQPNKKTISGDTATGTLVIYGHHVEPSSLIEPLRQLGYTLIRSAKQAA